MCHGILPTADIKMHTDPDQNTFNIDSLVSHNLYSSPSSHTCNSYTSENFQHEFNVITFNSTHVSVRLPNETLSVWKRHKKVHYG